MMKRNEREIVAAINLYADRISLPDTIREEALTMAKGIKRLPCEMVVFSVLYGLLKRYGLPNSPLFYLYKEEGTEAGAVPPKYLLHLFKLFVKRTGIEFKYSEIDYDSLIIKHCNRLGLSEKITTASIAIFSKLKNEITGKPSSIMAGAIYSAVIRFDGKRSQIEISDEVGVTDMALRRAYRQFSGKKIGGDMNGNNQRTI
jgi:transcription initiation factor TFIIIB Brf1 subunit/transcription initiation factor TFIIB